MHNQSVTGHMSLYCRALCCQAATTILLGIDVAHTEPWKLYGTVAAVLGCALGLWAALQVILWDYVVCFQLHALHP